MSVSKDKNRIMVSLTKTQIEKIDKIAKDIGITKSGVIAIAIMQYINNQKKN